MVTDAAAGVLYANSRGRPSAQAVATGCDGQLYQRRRKFLCAAIICRERHAYFSLGPAASLSLSKRGSKAFRIFVKHSDIHACCRPQ